VPVELRIEGEPYPLPPGIELAAYRTVQEGLTNVLKHAGASRARVVVRYETGRLELEVADDGRGQSGNGGGTGLAGLRERVQLYGGELEVTTAAGGGFALRLRIPISEESWR